MATEHSIEAASTDEGDRVAKLRVSFLMLERFMQLPYGATIKAAEVIQKAIDGKPDTLGIVFTVESPEFAPVPKGGKIPPVSATVETQRSYRFKRWVGDTAQQQTEWIGENK